MFIPDNNGIKVGQDFTNIQVRIDLTQFADGAHFAWDCDWKMSSAVGQGAWRHQGGGSMNLPTTNKDGSPATVAIQGQGIPLGARRGRFHVKECSLASTVTVGVVGFP